MQVKISDVIKSIVFTNKELAEFCGLSVSMIEQIRTGRKDGSRNAQARILQFIDKKIEEAQRIKEQFSIDK